ncbi:MAG: hypothetical protein PHC88_06775 [Terrimicrobiaceae bacterium]|nr:hypothetical protein [Terrimicrobiaceae bacterium]
MTLRFSRFPLVLCAGIALFATGCAVYPDGSAVVLPPIPIPVVVAPAYVYTGGYRTYYRPYYGYRSYGYRPYWGGYRGGYYHRGYAGGYYYGRGYGGRYWR